LGGEAGELLQVLHKALIPELKSESQFLVEFLSESVGLIEAVQNNKEVLHNNKANGSYMKREHVIELFNCL
jgi:hypothetical protein